MSGMLSCSGSGCCAVGITSHCTLCGNGFAVGAFPKATERSRDTMSVEGRRDSGFDAWTLYGVLFQSL